MSATIAIAVVVVSSASVGAAGRVGVVGPPGQLPGSTSVRCPHIKRVHCGSAKQSAVRALGAFAADLDSDRLRRGVSLPTLGVLFGRFGAAAERLAERRGLRAVASGSIARGAAGGLVSVGRVGGVKVSEGSSVRQRSGINEVVETDVLQTPRRQQIHTVTLGVSAQPCPEPNSLGSPEVPGMLVAIERFTTIERIGAAELTTEVELRISRNRIGGAVTFGALYDHASPDPGPGYVQLIRTRRVRDVRSGRTFREKPLELNYEENYVDPVWIDSGNFDAFVQQQADGDPVDALRSDRLINPGAFFAVASAFADAVAAKVRSAYKASEKIWRTPNRCVQLQMDAPSRLVPGQPVKLEAKLSSNHGFTPKQLADDGILYPFKSPELMLDPFARVPPDASATKTFTLTPPSTPWPDSRPLELDIDYRSQAGIGSVQKKFLAAAGIFEYAVTLAGGGTYTEQDKITTSSGTTTYNYTDTFTFNNHFPHVVIPFDGKPPDPSSVTSGADSGTLSGSIASNGTDQPTPGNSSSFTCAGSLYDNNLHAIGQLQANAAMASVALTGLSHLTADPSAGNCTTDGNFFIGITPGVGGSGQRNIQAAMIGTATIDPGEADKPSFSVTVQTPPIAPCVPDPGGSETCADSLSWQGNATFTKIETCTRNASGHYSCGLSSSRDARRRRYRY